MKETELFHPIKKWLEGQGYSVHGEVRNCDLVARKGAEMIIVETKLRLSLRLLLQSVGRQEVCNAVYMAVALRKSRTYPADFTAIKRLLRRLGLGLIFVRFLKTRTRVEIALHPGDIYARQRPSMRQSIIREIDGRYAEFNKSGEVIKTERITAYKQQSLYIVHMLADLGESSPVHLREQGLPPRTGAILSRNVYGWFIHPARGRYALSPEGRRALNTYGHIVREIVKNAKKMQKQKQKS
ncbi:MAG: DUF2161 family putative PD-(D/E)XK-type phosphodiesterase [Salinispira sp.]